MLGFRDRHVVVTGGAGALGGAVLAALSAEGAICHAPERAELELLDEDAVARWYAARPALWASIHLAGGFAMAPLEATSVADLRFQHDLNVVTCFLACREAARAIRRSAAGAGRIVNVASRAALVPSGGMLAYSASKAAVGMITQALAHELAPGILVNAVAPSIIDTPANRRAQPAADHASWPTSAEVAEAILWLASPRNTLTSGVVLPIYGKA